MGTPIYVTFFIGGIFYASIYQDFEVKGPLEEELTDKLIE